MEFAARLARFGGPKSCSAASERRVSCRCERRATQGQSWAGQGQGQSQSRSQSESQGQSAPSGRSAKPVCPSSALVSSRLMGSPLSVCACGRLPNLQQSAALCSAGAQDQVSCILRFFLPHTRVCTAPLLFTWINIASSLHSQRQPFFFAHFSSLHLPPSSPFLFLPPELPHAHMTRSVSLFCLPVG